MAKNRKEERGRTVWIPAFGTLLERARGRWDKGTALQRVKDLSPAFNSLDQSRLEYYEAGAVQHPDALLVWALAHVYGKNLTDWMAVLKWNRENLFNAHAPEGMHSIREADDMRFTGDDRSIIRRLRALSGDDQARVIHYLDMTIAAAEHGGARIAEGATFRRGKGR